MKQPKEPSLMSRRTGKPISQRVRHLLIGLLLVCVAMVSACQSPSQMPPSSASRLTVDPSLMVAPSYEKAMVDFLSNKPNEQTPK